MCVAIKIFHSAVTSTYNTFFTFVTRLEIVIGYKSCLADFRNSNIRHFSRNFDKVNYFPNVLNFFTSNPKYCLVIWQYALINFVFFIIFSSIKIFFIYSKFHKTYPIFSQFSPCNIQNIFFAITNNF